MKKRIFAMLLVIAMAVGMLPVVAGATSDATPEIKKVNMVLGGILGINFKVDAKGADMSGYSVRVTVGADASTAISTYAMEGNLYVYTFKLPAHKLPQSLKIELLNGSTVVQTEESWTVASYLEKLMGYNQDHAQLAALADALNNYGAYAAYYAEPTGSAPAVAAVEAVEQANIDYQHQILAGSVAGLGAAAALYLDDACDLQIKFSAAAWGENSLYVNDNKVKTNEVDGKVVYELAELVPQNWSKEYTVEVKDAGGNTVLKYTYSALSYAHAVLGYAQEPQAGLYGLVKAMYLYQKAAVDFINCDAFVDENGPIDEDDGPVIEF